MNSSDQVCVIHSRNSNPLELLVIQTRGNSLWDGDSLSREDTLFTKEFVQVVKQNLP